MWAAEQGRQGALQRLAVVALVGADLLWGMPCLSAKHSASQVLRSRRRSATFPCRQPRSSTAAVREAAAIAPLDVK